MTWNSHSMPIASNRYSVCKTEDGEEQRQRKTSVSEDVNYWLTFEWTLLGMRIREMSNRRSSRAAWAIEPSSANWWHHEGREWVSEREGRREEGEAPLWVYKFMFYPWPNTLTVSSMQLPINIPIPLSSRFFISFKPLCNTTQNDSLNGQLRSPLDPGQSNASISNPCLSSKNTWTRLVINRYLCCD